MQHQKMKQKSIILTSDLDDEEDEPDEREEKDEKGPETNEIVDQKLLENRKIFLWGTVDDDSARDIVSKLLYLETAKPGTEITLFINSHGGIISSGMAIIDTMSLISSPVTTVCMGLAASMGSLLLAAGKKGNRFIFPNGKVMIHQPSVDYLYGQATDLEIQTKQILKTRNIVAEMFAKFCKRRKDSIIKDMDRDYWMDASESIKYGIVDAVYSMPTQLISNKQQK